MTLGFSSLGIKLWKKNTGTPNSSKSIIIWAYKNK